MIRIIVERYSDGYVGYPLGMKGGRRWAGRYL